MCSEDSWPLTYRLLAKCVAVRSSGDETCNLMSPFTHVRLPVALIIPLWKRRLENTDVSRTIIKNESDVARTLVIHIAPVKSGGRRVENHKE